MGLKLLHLSLAACWPTVSFILREISFYPAVFGSLYFLRLSLNNGVPGLGHGPGVSSCKD